MINPTRSDPVRFTVDASRTNLSRCGSGSDAKEGKSCKLNFFFSPWLNVSLCHATDQFSDTTMVFFEASKRQQTKCNFKNQPYSQLWRLITAVLNQWKLVRSPRKYMKIEDKQKQGNNLCKRESWCTTKVKLHLGNIGQVLHDYLSPSLNSVWFASSSTNECKIQTKPRCWPVIFHTLFNHIYQEHK